MSLSAGKDAPRGRRGQFGFAEVVVPPGL